MAAINADILRKHFGFNDPNVIEGILRDPNQVSRYSREYEGILHPGQPAQADSASFVADQTAARAALNKARREEEQGFLGRFRTEFPTVLTGIEQTLGLPGLRETAQTGVQALKALPEEIRVASQGRDVSAGQLQRMTSARQAERLPEINDLLSALQFKEEEFGRQAGRAILPYETEIDLMKSRFADEATGFNEDNQNELNLLLQQIQTGAQLSIAEMSRATQLAQMEADKENVKNTIDAVDLGNKVAIYQNGNFLRYENKGKLSTLGSGNDSLNLRG